MTIEDLIPGAFRRDHCSLALDRMQDAGVDWVAVVVLWSQPTIDSKQIGPDPRFTLPDADLRWLSQELHNRGLKVLLKPHLDVRDQYGSPTFRGRIGEGFSSADWGTWFAAYRLMILHFAEIARDTDCQQFSIGCELAEAAKQEAHWRALIADVRQIYRPSDGEITYVANHGKEATEHVKFWDAVDFIGVDAYYELTESLSPSLAELKAAWGPGVAELRELHQQTGKRIALTEIGWMASNGSNRTPWDYHCGALDQSEQSDCYRATYEVLQPFESSWLQGVFFYTWGCDPFDGGPADDGYSPYDKPAEDVIRQWYGAGSRPVRSTLLPSWPSIPTKVQMIYSQGQVGPGWSPEVWNGTIELTASDPDNPASKVLRASDLIPWDAVAFYRDPVDVLPGDFTWLAFRIRGPVGMRPMQFWAQFAVPLADPAFKRLGLRHRPIDDPRYTPYGLVLPGSWQEVRIPLEHLNADGQSLVELRIQDRCGQRVPEFWLDSIRLLS